MIFYLFWKTGVQEPFMVTHDYDDNDIVIIRIDFTGELRILKAFMLADLEENSYTVISNMGSAAGVSQLSSVTYKGLLNTRAARHTVKEISETVTDHNGKEYESVRAMCDAYGVSQQMFYRKKRQGRTLEECLSRGHAGRLPGQKSETNAEKAPRQRVKKEKIPAQSAREFEFAGKTYKSRRDFCSKNDIDYQRFNSLIKEGNTMEEAMRLIAERPYRRIRKGQEKKQAPAPVIVRRIKKENKDIL